VLDEWWRRTYVSGRRRAAMNPEFLSGEASAAPAVADLLSLAHELAEVGVPGGALGARNGLRTTTHADLPWARLGDQDFVEVADYDPNLGRLLCIGKRAPTPDAPLLALILRAKKELAAVAVLQGQAARAPPGTPSAKRGSKPVEDALAALEGLRSHDIVVLGDDLVVAASRVAELRTACLSVLGAQG